MNKFIFYEDNIYYHYYLSWSEMGIFSINEKDVNKFIKNKDYKGLEKALNYKNNSFIRLKVQH